LAALLAAIVLVRARYAAAGQVPGAASDPDIPVSHRDRVYAAEQFSNTVSVTDPVDNKLLGVVDGTGRKISLPRGSSDAALAPYHVERSKLFVLDRVAAVEELDSARIAQRNGFQSRTVRFFALRLRKHRAI
jgi:hypothetical protein